MPRVSLVRDSCWQHSHYAIQNANLLVILRPLAEATAYLELEALGQFCFISVELLLQPKAVKSSPWTTTLTHHCGWKKQHGEAPRATNPIFASAPE